MKLHADHLAVFNDQLVGGGAKHDLVVLVRSHHRVVRNGEICAPLAGVFHTVHHAADRRILALPQAADERGLLGVVKNCTLRNEPRLDLLTALDELVDQVVTAVHPLAVVSIRTQTAVVSLEDMQVDGGEQGELRLLNARVQLRLCPVEIRLDLFLECLQRRQIFLMDAADSVQRDIARDKRMIGIQRAVKRLFRPVEDGLERIDTTRIVLHLVIGLTVQRVDAGGRIRIFRIPDEVRHHGLERTAGNQRIAAHLGVLFQNNHRAAVLRCLRRRNHARAARADDDHVIGLLDRRLSGMLNSRRLERAEVGALRLRRSVIDGVAQRGTGECRTGNAVHAGTVRRQHILDHRLESHVADMRGFLGIGHFNRRHGILGERHVDGYIAVVALRGSGVCARLERDSRIVSRRFTSRLCHRLCQRFLHSRAGHGCACNAVHLGIRRADQRRIKRFDCRAADCRCLIFADHLNGGHRAVVHGDLHGYSAAKALCRRFILARRKPCRAARRQRSCRQHHRKTEGNDLLIHVLFPFHMVCRHFVMPTGE